MKNLRDVEIIPGRSRSDLVKIRAALRLIERGLHSERFKLFGQSNCWRLEFELWQTKIDVALLEFCAAGEDVSAQFRFEPAEPVYFVWKKDHEL